MIRVFSELQLNDLMQFNMMHVGSFGIEIYFGKLR